jgi:multiple antibiotic resistance protein
LFIGEVFPGGIEDQIIASKLGKTGINVVTRIMGLIMAAIGIEFIANGSKQLFPGLS